MGTKFVLWIPLRLSCLPLHEASSTDGKERWLYLVLHHFHQHIYFVCVCVCYTHVNVQVCVPVHAYVEARAGCWVSSLVLFAVVT